MPKDTKPIASCKIIINDYRTTIHKAPNLRIRHNPPNLETKAKERAAERLRWKNKQPCRKDIKNEHNVRAGDLIKWRFEEEVYDIGIKIELVENGSIVCE